MSDVAALAGPVRPQSLGMPLGGQHRQHTDGKCSTLGRSSEDNSSTPHDIAGACTDQQPSGQLAVPKSPQQQALSCISMAARRKLPSSYTCCGGPGGPRWRAVVRDLNTPFYVSPGSPAAGGARRLAVCAKAACGCQNFCTPLSDGLKHLACTGFF